KRKAPAPAKKSSSDEAVVPAPSDDKRPPLKINVDTRPINRDAFERVSYASIVKRTAASVVYVYSSKTVKGQDLSDFFNDPRFRRFFNIPGGPGSDEDESVTPPNPGGKNPRTTPKGNRKGGGNSRSRIPDQTQQ